MGPGTPQIHRHKCWGSPVLGETSSLPVTGKGQECWEMLCVATCPGAQGQKLTPAVTAVSDPRVLCSVC